MQDLYNMLSFKTYEFWKTVSKRYKADYVVKIDDDNYVRLDRLAVAIRQWNYLGTGKLASMPSFTHVQKQTISLQVIR